MGKNLNINTGIENKLLIVDYQEYKDLSEEKPLDTQICIITDGGDFYNIAGWDNENKCFVNQFGMVHYKFKYWTPLIQMKK